MVSNPRAIFLRQAGRNLTIVPESVSIARPVVGAVKDLLQVDSSVFHLVLDEAA